MLFRSDPAPCRICPQVCAVGRRCWKSRVRPLLDGDDKDRPENLCIDVAGDLPRCLDLIGADEVIRRIDLYLRGGVARELASGEASLIRPLVDA